MTYDYGQLFRALLPEAILVGGALIVLTIDLILGRGASHATRVARSSALAFVALVGAGFAAALNGGPASVFDGSLVLDPLTTAGRIGVLVLAALAVGVLPGNARLQAPAEFVAILLLATSGFTLMAASQQLLVAFLAIELASLSLYVLAGFDRDRSASAEAALKYFLFGGMSAAFLLFGFSLLYGLTGALDFATIGQQLRMSDRSPLLLVAVAMVLVAFGFKAAAAPFHLWAPDVYQGAPGPAAALIASASKLAGFIIFMRLLWGGLGYASGDAAGWPVTVGWIPVAALIALGSLLLGNIGALAQSSVRRLLAYSAIAHAGALLLGVMVAGHHGPGPVFYYAATYGLATVGIFGVFAVLEQTGSCDQLSDLAGLYRRSPFLTACLAVFVLSLAGIPPLAGFFGKFVVFAGALSANGIAGPVGWLALAAIALSAVALYYYLLVLKQALVAPVPASAPEVRIPVSALIALTGAAAGLVLLGVFPSVVLGFFA